MGAAAVGLTGVIVAAAASGHDRRLCRSACPSCGAIASSRGLLHFDGKMMVELFQVGLPIAMAYLFETGLFFAVTRPDGQFSRPRRWRRTMSVLNVCAVTFMIPYALSARRRRCASAMRLAPGSPEAARRAGYVAVWLGIGWMMLAALTMLIAPSLLTGDLSRSVGSGECVGGAAGGLAVRDRRDLPDRRRHAGDDPRRAARAQGHHGADGDLRPRLLGVRPRQRRHHGLLAGLRRAWACGGAWRSASRSRRRCCSCAGGACRGA